MAILITTPGNKLPKCNCFCMAIICGCGGGILKLDLNQASKSQLIQKQLVVENIRKSINVLKQYLKNVEIVSEQVI